MTPIEEPVPVYVVSWVNWFAGEQTSGGFDWFYTEDDARVAFRKEAYAQEHMAPHAGARLRLVEVQIPRDVWLRSPAATTTWIDDRIDLIEDFRQTRAQGDRCLAVALAVA